MKNSFKMQLRSACSILSGIALVALFGAVPAHASIISTTGPVLLVSAPASVVPGASVNTTDGQAFAEQQNVTLSSPLAVDATNPGTYSDGSGPGGTISAGTNVSSYFVLFDSGGASVTYGTVTLTFSTAV